jgi:hypothetical protein
MDAALVADHAMLVLRPPSADDAAFLRNSWVKSYAKWAAFRPGEEPRPYKGAGPARTHSHIYMPEQHALVGRILDKATTLVACNPAEHWQIFGYIVGERRSGFQDFDRPLVHYWYVKDGYRKLGIGRALWQAMAAILGPGPYWATHFNPIVAGHVDKLGVEFNDYPLRR